MKLTIYTIFLGVLFYATSVLGIEPQVKPKTIPQRILFVGNSFTYFNDSIHNHLGHLLRAAGQYQPGKTRLRTMTISGGKLAEHAGGITTMVKQGQWDMVVLQGHSTAMLKKESARDFTTTAQQFSKHIRKMGAEPVLFMTWGYQNEPEMIQPISRRYLIVANKLDVMLVPVGLAFKQINEQYPEIDLYAKDIAKFKQLDSGQVKTIYKKSIKHPSEAGTYLAACVFYAALFQNSPEGLDYTATIDVDKAKILQKTATQVVTQFYAKAMPVN